MRNTYPVAERLLSLVDRVDRGEPLTIKGVMEAFSVDERCARNYIAFVREQRPLTEYREGRTKVWRKPAEPDMTVERAAALDFAVQALGELEGSGHLEALRDMAHQARLALGDVEQLQLDRVTRNFQVRTSERTRNPHRGKWIQKLLDALHHRRVCHIEYQGLNGFVGRHEVEPWGLLLHRGRLLCVAGKRSHKRPRPARRMYLVDGITKVSPTRQRFAEPPPRHTDYAEIFRDSFGIFCDLPEEPVDVHLRVRGPHAIDLEQRVVHPSQQNERREDGTVDVRMRLVICPELIGFVLGLLPHVEVVAPSELRDRVDRAVHPWNTGLPRPA